MLFRSAIRFPPAARCFLCSSATEQQNLVCLSCTAVPALDALLRRACLVGLLGIAVQLGACGANPLMLYAHSRTIIRAVHLTWLWFHLADQPHPLRQAGTDSSTPPGPLIVIAPVHLPPPTLHSHALLFEKLRLRLEAFSSQGGYSVVRSPPAVVSHSH